ncbi:hypothetical protein [uncultured Roseibium sp.]|uniref:hypothetical protein n=1 Tax=uncultured Roseibium sp. TaxID=1936171 RepID=UPI00262A205C|nr:hypothetical protein [uncultured Roseibium sp.]
MNVILDWVARNRESVISTSIALVTLIAVVTASLTALCGSAVPLPAGETCTQCVRSWIGALSGWAAACAAAGAIIFMRQANKLQREALVTPELDRLSREIRLGYLVSEDLLRCGAELRQFANPGESEKPQTFADLWSVRITGKNIDEEMDFDCFREVESCWNEVSEYCREPNFSDTAKSRRAAQVLPGTEAPKFLNLYSTCFTASKNVYETFILPRQTRIAELTDYME